MLVKPSGYGIKLPKLCVFIELMKKIFYRDINVEKT